MKRLDHWRRARARSVALAGGRRAGRAARRHDGAGHGCDAAGASASHRRRRRSSIRRRRSRSRSTTPSTRGWARPARAATWRRRRRPSAADNLIPREAACRGCHKIDRAAADEGGAARAGAPPAATPATSTASGNAAGCRAAQSATPGRAAARRARASQPEVQPPAARGARHRLHALPRRRGRRRGW